MTTRNSLKILIMIVAPNLSMAQSNSMVGPGLPNPPQLEAVLAMRTSVGSLVDKSTSGHKVINPSVREPPPVGMPAQHGNFILMRGLLGMIRL